MTRNECVRILTEEYANRRARKEAEAAERLREVTARDPEIARLRKENALLALDTLKKVSLMTDEKQRREAAAAMRDRGIENNRAIAAKLSALGYPSDYLAVHYSCEICRDTGLVGEAPSRFCECFEREMRSRMYAGTDSADNMKECFEYFDLQRFPEADGQRETMAQIRKICEDYANTFPETRFKNLVLTGAGGLGKTFLLNSIYTRVIEHGGEAIRITAYRLFEAMRRQYFANEAGDRELDTLLNIPLLLIDDLGSEPMMRNITVESMFILLNERSQSGKHTVISTNLSPLQIQERYGERVMSRMFDRTRCAALLLKGKDLRRL